MRALERYVDDVIYLRYDPAGGHNDRILRALPLSDGLAEALRAEATGASQLNPSLSHKQTVALLNLEVLAARAEATLDRATLCERLRSGSLAFDDDGRCDLVGLDTARQLHEDALHFAHECGLDAYVSFFEAEEPDARRGRRARMAPDVLSDQDLELLARECQPVA
jgi:hypothetical protein